MKKIINKIINETFNTNIIENQEITSKGIVNRVFIAITSNSQKYIVRLRDNVKVLDEYEKEKWCIKQADEIGLLSPIVYAVGIIDDYAYMVESFISGTNGADLVTKYNDLWEKLGEYAKRINSIKAFGFGLDFKNEKFYNNFTPNWESFVNYNINSLDDNDELINLGVYDIARQPFIKKTFNKLLITKFKFGLCHSDLSPRNTITNDKGIYLIDWGSALINIYPHYDIITLLKAQIMGKTLISHEDLTGGIPSVEQCFLFLKGYGISKLDYEKIEKDIYALLLLDAFDKLRWAIDNNKDSINEFSIYAKTVLVESIEKIVH